MWKVIIVLAVVKSGFCGLFDFTEYDDPYSSGNFFFNRPSVIIRQHHGRCISRTDGTNQEGVCLTRPECTFSGGQPNGRQSCRLGTCCVYSRGCKQTSTNRVSYFEGSTENVDNSVCTYIVRTENSNICQMRLDFDSLNLPPPSRDLIPDTNGNIVPIGPYLCRDAFFQVESPNNNGRIPTLCGNNNGQHIYVPVNASRGERELVIKIVNNVASNNNNGNSVSWKIKITQIECPNIQKHQNSLRVWEDSLIKAPDGCLQYHQAPSGTIRSLGYNTAGTSASNHYEANLNYAICFRRINDMCGIDFNVDEFQLGGIYDTDGSEVTSGTPSWCNVPILTGSTIYRDADYLFIPNGVYMSVDSNTPNTATSANEDRYCGNLVANTVIRSVTPGPFYIYFKTDNQVLGPNNDPYPTADTEISAPTADPENGWELTYNTLYGSSCGSLV